MLLPSLIAYLLALVFFVVAVQVRRSVRKAELRDAVAKRLDGFEPPRPLAGSASSGRGPQFGGNWLASRLWRAGIVMTLPRAFALTAGAALGVLVAWYAAGADMALAALLAMLALSALVPWWRYRKRVAAMVQQIPMFLDQVVRALNTGRSLDGALLLATEAARPPLREVMVRVQLLVDLGVDMGDAMRGAARLFALDELYIIALALQIARTHGSSPKEILASVTQMIRSREQASRELHAMTGETRASAWILGLLPSALAAYMTFTNPGYLGGMWHDPAGHTLLLTALGMQVAGGAILGIMVRSVG
ncbi:MAG: type II secretion system F family protein [Betaproteobacteria bacterium]|nr:type II secretion system F family protein [Betaproteobacteria bacterium]